MNGCIKNWVVVSNMFYLHPYMGKISYLTNMFQTGWSHMKPPTREVSFSISGFHGLCASSQLRRLNLPARHFRPCIPWPLHVGIVKHVPRKSWLGSSAVFWGEHSRCNRRCCCCCFPAGGRFFLYLWCMITIRWWFECGLILLPLQIGGLLKQVAGNPARRKACSPSVAAARCFFAI